MRPPSWIAGCAALAVLLLQTPAAAQEPAGAAGVPGSSKPSPQFYFAIYPNFLAQYDPVSDRIVRKIPFENGMMWDVELLHDQQHFAVVTGQQAKKIGRAHV